MMSKRKIVAAAVAALALGCVWPLTRAGASGTTRQTLTLPELPHTPEMQPMRGWEPGIHLIPTTAQSAFLVLKKDPDDPNRFLAWGFDPAAGINLFSFTAPMSALTNFYGTWVLDSGAWRAIASSGVKDEGITDGVGGVPPPPKPSLRDDQAWKHAFYAWSAQDQIAKEVEP